LRIHNLLNAASYIRRSSSFVAATLRGKGEKLFTVKEEDIILGSQDTRNQDVDCRTSVSVQKYMFHEREGSQVTELVPFMIIIIVVTEGTH
jgi:hypothetical protein